MAASFGEQMQAEREAQGITLREVAEQTRISLRYLEALEANDFKVLPGGVFNRSFIKTYAKYIGFDEGKALQLYQESNYESSQDDETLLSRQPKVYTDDHTSGSPIGNLLLVGGALLLLGLGIYGFVRWYTQPAATPATAPAATPTPAQIAAATPAPSVPVSSSPGATPAPNATPGASPAAGSAPPPTPPPAGSLTVQVRAKDSPVMIAVGTDGAKLGFITLKPGESRDFSPQQNVALQYQSPGERLLEIYINGQAVNLGQFPGTGKNKQVDFNIDRNDYQKYLSSSAPPAAAATPTP